MVSKADRPTLMTKKNPTDAILPMHELHFMDEFRHYRIRPLDSESGSIARRLHLPSARLTGRAPVTLEIHRLISMEF